MKIKRFNEEYENFGYGNVELSNYVQSSIEKVKKRGGNPINLSDYGLLELSYHLETYSISNNFNSPTSNGFYSDKTIDIFKQLVDSITNDEIENNKEGE